jgi:hypothetical protein
MLATHATSRACAALATVLALFLPAPAEASIGTSDLPGGFKFEIEVVAVNGSGCPDDNATVEHSPDNTIRIVYSSYAAAAGEGAKPTDFRKNCQIVLRVTVMDGMTYALTKTRSYGYAELADGTTGSYRVHRYFQGSPETEHVTSPFTGPYDGSWQDDGETGVAQQVWAPCGEDRYLNINTELRVVAKRSQPLSTLYLDSTVISPEDFRFKWCPGRGS